jgi:hypothetical protein
MKKLLGDALFVAGIAFFPAGCGGAEGAPTRGAPGENPPIAGVGVTQGPSGCSVDIGRKDASLTVSTTTATGSADLSPRGLSLRCAFDADRPVYPLLVHCRAPSYTVRLDLPSVTKAGRYWTHQADVTEACPGGGQYAFGNGACVVDVDAFAPATREGRRARFSGSGLSPSNFVSSNDPGGVVVSGTMSLPAPSQPVAVGFAPQRSCTLDVSGAYTFRANGSGDNAGCTVWADDAELAIDPFTLGRDVELSISGQTWCPSCTTRYGGLCTSSVVLDEGPNGRFVADFLCTNLRGGDSTAVTVKGHIDGRHSHPDPK